MESWAVWDVETLRWAYEVPGGWSNPRGFGLAVAKALDETGQMHTFYEDDGPAMIDFLARKQLLIGFNSLHFDCGVLAAHGDVSELQRRSLDLLLSLDQATGIPHCVSLNRAARTTFGQGKLLPDGGEAVRLWRSGSADDRALVEKYCERDVLITARLWTYGALHGHVFVPLRGEGGRRGNPRTRVTVRWPAPAQLPKMLAFNGADLPPQ